MFDPTGYSKANWKYYPFVGITLMVRWETLAMGSMVLYKLLGVWLENEIVFILHFYSDWGFVIYKVTLSRYHYFLIMIDVVKRTNTVII